ncbi:hypothetical protein EDB87DRAFT_744415 [Lactarius vividus]|nr:hypothetical protein EDB87DRAFT_744415 [Lactarius vividus]
MRATKNSRYSNLTGQLAMAVSRLRLRLMLLGLMPRVMSIPVVNASVWSLVLSDFLSRNMGADLWVPPSTAVFPNTLPESAQ